MTVNKENYFSIMLKKIFLVFLFFLLSTNSFAKESFSYPDNLPSDVEIFGDLRQGGFLFGKTLPGSVVEINKEKIPVSEKGIFIAGIDRDTEKNNNILIISPNKSKKNISFEVSKRSWLIQKIKGLPDKMVSPDEKTVEQIKKDNEQIREVRNNTSDNVYFDSKFIMPVNGDITSVFGSQRILNGEKRSPHSGIDIKAATGTPVKAAANGVVSLINDDMYLSGKTVMISHGLGLSTIYIHLDSITTKLGKQVKQGDVIGTVGATGRATGPHLHFGVSVGNIKIDPESFLNIGLPKFIKN